MQVRSPSIASACLKLCGLSRAIGMTTGILLDTVLEITTGIGCGVACRFCPQSRLSRAYRRRPGGRVHLMSFEVFAGCVRKLPRQVDIDFSGYAEPWGNPECTRMLLFALERGHDLRIYTTLRGVTRADVDVFAAIPPARLKQFSVHLPSRDPGLERHPADPGYLEVLARLIETKIPPLRFNVHGSGPDPKVAGLLAAHGVPLPEPRDTCTRAGNVDLSGIAALRNRPPPEKIAGKLGCRRPGWRVLLPNGEVALCCMDYGLDHVFGSLLEQDFETVFYGAAWSQVERARDDEALDVLCRRCDVWAYTRN
jgi:hypothetical protein